MRRKTSRRKGKGKRRIRKQPDEQNGPTCSTRRAKPPKQAVQMRCSWRLRSRMFCEHCLQMTSPHSRQWCLASQRPHTRESMMRDKTKVENNELSEGQSGRCCRWCSHGDKPAVERGEHGRLAALAQRRLNIRRPGMANEEMNKSLSRKTRTRRKRPQEDMDQGAKRHGGVQQRVSSVCRNGARPTDHRDLSAISKSMAARPPPATRAPRSLYLGQVCTRVLLLARFFFLLLLLPVHPAACGSLRTGSVLSSRITFEPTAMMMTVMTSKKHQQ